MSKQYHLPVRPYTPIDSLNRSAAAKGSPGYAMATAYANYNGHLITIGWNDYRGYYITEYWWAGRVVLARGSFKDCLSAAISEYNRGALGTSVSVHIREGDTEAEKVCQETPGMVEGREGKSDWYTWKHQYAAESVKDYCFPNSLARIFDWQIMEDCATAEEYNAAIRAKYGKCFR